MRILGLVLGFMLLTSCAFADVTAQIISYDKDDNGNIRVWSQYKIDGVEVQSNYPKIDNKYVFATRYNAVSFAGMNETEIKVRVLEDVTSHTETLIYKTFMPKANQEIVDKQLSSIINATVSKVNAAIQVDIDKDGVADKEWTIKTDGTKVEKDI